MAMEKMQTVVIPMESLAEVILLQLQNGGKANLTVTGSSMMPMLRHRKDSVFLVPVAHRQKPGDIILYLRDNGQYILHRIIRLAGEGYICCGDNQYEPEQVEHRQLIAVVEEFTRKGKHYTIETCGYRLYTALWIRLFFLRKPYIALRRHFGRLRSRLCK